ncbi:cation:proton antiporter [Nonomuraea sp. NPDC049141]|uniref:cation:proton antiporter n=1 Tax=Nonomuraea sp. NPDC049141 TaxID=3155500 RepID=UPI0033CD43AA
MNGSGLSTEALVAVVMADIAAILLLGAVLGKVARRLGQPPVMGEIVAGVALGPSLLGLLPGNPTHILFPVEARPLLSAVSQVGLLLFMFGVGWELDARLIKGFGKVAAGVSVGSIGLAFGLGVGLATFLYDAHALVGGRQVPYAAFVLFLGAAMSVTAFPVLARILHEHRMTNTRIGVLALASAAVDDVLAWCLLALVTMVATAGGSEDLLRLLTLTLLYAAAMLLVVRPLLTRFVRFSLRPGRPSALLAVIVAGVLLSSCVTAWIGIHPIFGAFAFGVIMPREPGDELFEVVRRPLQHMSAILLPVFFIVTGLGVNVGSLGGAGLLELTAIVLVAVAGKLLGSVIPGRLFGLSWREAATLGVLVNTRGLTEIVMLTAGVSLGVLDDRLFTMMVLMALITTMMAGPLLPKRPHAEPVGIRPLSRKEMRMTETADRS